MESRDITTATELGSRIKETPRALTRDVELAAQKPARLDEATKRAIEAFENLPALDELRFESAEPVQDDDELFDALEDRLRWALGVVSALSDLPGLDIPNSNALGSVIDHLEEADEIYAKLRRRHRDGQEARS